MLWVLFTFEIMSDEEEVSSGKIGPDIVSNAPVIIDLHVIGKEITSMVTTPP